MSWEITLPILGKLGDRLTVIATVKESFTDLVDLLLSKVFERSHCQRVLKQQVLAGRKEARKITIYTALSRDLLGYQRSIFYMAPRPSFVLLNLATKGASIPPDVPIFSPSSQLKHAG